VFSTNFNGGKNSINKRISSIMDTKKKKVGAEKIYLAVVLIFGTGMLFAYNIPTAKASDFVASSTDKHFITDNNPTQTNR
jgi:hypothetical protein